MNQMNKKKITLILVRKLFIRSYLQSGIVDRLSKEFDLTIVCTDDLVSYFDKYNITLKISQDYLYRRYLHQLLFDLHLFKYRNLSVSFDFRIDRLFRNYKPQENFKNAIKKFRNFIYSNYILQDILIYFIKTFLNFEFLIDKNLKNKESNIILLPSSAYDSVIMDAIIVNKKLASKSFLLIDNWDNLSSKSIFWKQPDFVSVWGPQSAEHASNIQKFRDAKILELGCPRFDIYSSDTFDIFPRNNYVLFLGTTVYFREEEVLRVISKFINNEYESLNCQNLIIYRPHPARLGPTDISNLPGNVVVDSGVPLNSGEFPSLSDYPNLIRNAKFCIGGYTSMLIETVINNKKYFALRHAEGHLTSPDVVAERYEHFKGVDNMKNVYPIYDLEELNITVKRGLTEPTNSVADYDYILNFSKEKTFCERLIDTLHEI
jgi:hypothetical protein